MAIGGRTSIENKQIVSMNISVMLSPNFGQKDTLIAILQLFY